MTIIIIQVLKYSKLKNNKNLFMIHLKQKIALMCYWHLKKWAFKGIATNVIILVELVLSIYLVKK